MPGVTRRQFLGRAALAAMATPVLGMRELQTLGPAAGPIQEPWVRTVAGTGSAGNEPDLPLGADALDTPVDNPYGIVPGPDGALYFCEVDTGRIRRMDLGAGRIRTVAGAGSETSRAPGIPDRSLDPMEVSFFAPHEIRFDGTGALFVVERDAHVVRRIDPARRFVTRVAGTGEEGFSGDGGPAVDARLRQPHSIAFDADGHLLICDIGNHRVRILDLGSGTIDTFAGTGEREMTPDEAPIEGAPLLGPRSIDTDPQGNAYLVLREGNAVFRLEAGAGRLERIAGTGERGFEGDRGPAIDATFNGPKGIAYSVPDHSLYIVDTENHAVRRMRLESGIIETVLGSGVRADGPDGDPLACGLARPHGVCILEGVVYVTDSENHRIRALEGSLPR